MKTLVWVFFVLGLLSVPLDFLKFSYFSIMDISVIVILLYMIATSLKKSANIKYLLFTILFNSYVLINLTVNSSLEMSNILVILGNQVLFWFVFTNFEKSKPYSNMILAGFVFLIVIGVYRVAFPDVGSEVLHWWWKKYPYFGIRYTQSTRNSDAFYFLFGLMFTFLSYRLGVIRSRGVYILLTLIFGLSIIFSFSRGAWITLLISYLILLVVPRKNISPRFIITTFLVGLSFFLLIFSIGYLEYFVDKLVSIFSGTISSSNQERLDLLYQGFITALKNPLGIGLNNTSNLFDFGNFENVYMNVLVELGAVAFVALLLFLIYPVLSIIYTGKRDNKAQIVLVIFTVVIVYGLFNSLFLEPLFWITTALGYNIMLRSDIDES